MASTLIDTRRLAMSVAPVSKPIPFEGRSASICDSVAHCLEDADWPSRATGALARVDEDGVSEPLLALCQSSAEASRLLLAMSKQ